MPRRRTRVRGAVAVALLAALGALGGCGGAPAGTSAAPHFRDGGDQLDTPLPAAVRNMRFTDENGHHVRLSDFAGKTIVLGDILTLCQEHCPIDTATFVQLARASAARSTQDARDTVFLSITIDPARDTPAQLAAYRKVYVGAPSHLPQWHLLTASPADLSRLWRLLHVYVQKVPDAKGHGAAAPHNWRTGQRLTYDVDHSDVVYFIDRAGRERFLFAGQPYLHGAHVPARMQRFMTAEGHRNEKQGTWTADEGLQVLDWIQRSS